MRNSVRGRFRVWDRSQDSFNGEDLVYNFDVIDELIGGQGGTSGPSGTEYNGVPSTWLGYNDSLPSSSATKYPGTTNSGFESQTGRRTLYSVISGLNYNDVPLGTIITWWRPNSSIAIPDGWAVCDGRTIAQENHSYPISGAITLPDMRNKMVVGADSVTPGINALGGYRLAANATGAAASNNDWTGVQKVAGTTGAPGIGYDAGLETTTRTGSNQPKDISHNHNAGTLAIKDHIHTISHTHQIDRHNHTVAEHSHSFDHVHIMPNHIHNLNPYFSGQEVRADGTTQSHQTVKQGTSGPNLVVADRDHIHKLSAEYTHSRRPPISQDGCFFGSGNPIWGNGGYPTDMRNMEAVTDNYTAAAVTSRPTSFTYYGFGVFNAHNLNTVTGGKKLTTDFQEAARTINQSTSDSGNITGATPQAITESKGLTGSTSVYNATINVRPQYVGLLYLMKVKVSTNII